MIKGIDILAVESLEEAMLYMSLPSEFLDEYKANTGELALFENNSEYSGADFSEVVGQEVAKRAAALAAAGFHHILMTGPPGTGKSLIAKRISGILPKLTYEESLEVTTIYSVAGKLSPERPYICERPFLSPHHGASPGALVGGGPNAMPGIISLAHKGTLFLDEMPEFKRETLDYLRQPLEDGEVTVSRAKRTVKYPAEFMLVGAMNPCPCGFYPDRNKCTCSEASVNKYLARISGPIIDRIDICVEVSRMSPEELEEKKRISESSAQIRKKVEAAVKLQKLRYKDESFDFNSQIPSSKIPLYIPLSDEAAAFMHSLYKRLGLSMRAYYKIIRVARTIADYDGDERVEVKHLAEASCYRFPDYMGV